MMKNEVVILLFIFLFGIQNIYSQDNKVIGKVVAFESIPLRNVEVIVKSSGKVVKTDSAGFFSVLCKSKDKISFSANGFSSYKTTIKGKVEPLSINMVFKGGEKNVEIATGFNYIDKDKLTYAVVHLGAKNIKTTSYSNILEMIQSRAPGVNVSNNNIYIRGKNTLTGNDAALLVIDGTVISWNEFVNIDPQTVKSINVLKGSAGSLYGSRGMNGVVVVTTKKNK